VNAPNAFPPDITLLFKSAVEARQNYDFQKCFDLLELARRNYPTAIPPYVELARTHGKRYNYPEAKRFFDEAIKMSRRSPSVLTVAGTSALQFGNYEMARDYLAEVAKRDDAPVEALAYFAEILERQRQFEEARQVVERALKAAPQNPVAVLVSAKLQRQAGQLEDAEKNLRAFLAAPPGNDFPVTRCWYELGNNLDRQGRYDDAMAAFLQAKAMMEPQAGPQRAKIISSRNGMRKTEAAFLPEVIERWARFGEQLRPHHRFTVLSGHPRSGTTLLEQVIDAHPDLISADENRVFLEEALGPASRRFANEVPLLTRLEALSLADFQKIRSNYFRYIELFMGEAVGGRMLVEKNPSLSGALPAVMCIFPEARFLVAIRDPRDVCLSCFMQPLPLNPISAAYLTLEGTVEQYASAMTTWDIMLPRMRNPHLLVRYEDVIEDLESESRRVLEFLGLGWDERVLKFHEHAQAKTVRSPTYADVAKPIFKTAKGRWHNYQKYLEPVLNKLEPFVKKFGYE